VTARIEKDFTFLSGIFFEGHYLQNLYHMTLYIDIVTDDDQEQLTALERIHYFLRNYVEHSVFVCEENKQQITLLEKAGLTVLSVPEDPYDQIVGLILLRKFNAITEGRIFVNEIRFTSKLSADIRFYNTAEHAEEFDDLAWFNDPNLTIENANKKVKKEKIVKFDDLEDWNKVGLVWNNKLTH